MTATIPTLNDQNSEITFELKKGESFLIGRTPYRKSDNQIFIQDITVSNQHVELFAHPEGISAKDLKSTNGTAIDGEWLRPGISFPVRNGSLMLLGKKGTAFLQIFFESKGDGAQKVTVLRTSPKIDEETEKIGADSEVSKWLEACRETDKAICPICHKTYDERKVLICPADGGYLGRKDDPKDGPVAAKHYRLCNYIGTGSLTEVYKVEHIRLERPYALKVFHSGVHRETETAHIIQSAKQWGRLEHSSIASLVEWGWLTKDELFLVMEYFQNPSLEQYVKTNGPLSAKEIVKVFAPVCSALKYAHSQGVFHSNLKLSKIYVANLKAHPVVKISDFGLTDKLVKNLGWVKATLRTRDQTGHPLTTSPEYWQGEGLTPVSDIYAVGCALYHALTGVPVFDKKRTMETIAAHIYAEPAPIPEQLHVPPEMSAIVERCIKKQPEERYQSIDELVAALEAVD
ncbi:MAG TPA: FHA domain-containing serine/threonine-protein kinase [Candidatus Melainabacteria bacterium]|nr:FHA domain-containing serine/threonine-protein kinase [Candidatus Melainabacteria bacterium]